MKNLAYVVALAGAFLCAGPVQANQTTTLAPHQIRYERRVPPAVSRLLPPRTRSCFFGHFQARKGGEKLAVHLYQYFPKKPREDNYYYGLHLFKIQEGGKPLLLYRKHSFIVINYPWAQKFYGAEFHWLDPQKQTQPIIAFRMTDMIAQGPFGVFVPVVFSSDWKKIVSSDRFSYGAGDGAAPTVDCFFLPEPDEKGFIRLQYTSESPSPNGMVSEGSVHKWDGKRFEHAP